MSEYTKGKWEATIIGDVVYIVAAHKEIAIICIKPDAGHLYKPIEMEANARLIAAAPTLLEACEFAAKPEAPFSTDQLTFANRMIQAIEEKAKAAIAVAKE